MKGPILNSVSQLCSLRSILEGEHECLLAALTAGFGSDDHLCDGGQAMAAKCRTLTASGVVLIFEIRLPLKKVCSGARSFKKKKSVEASV
jgi:hypothetical protein